VAPSEPLYMYGSTTLCNPSRETNRGRTDVWDKERQKSDSRLAEWLVGIGGQL